MNKEVINIPEGCDKATIEKLDDNKYVITFEPKKTEFKRGDVVTINDDYIVIFKEINHETDHTCSYCSYNKTINTGYFVQIAHNWTSYNIRLATEEEKQLLFDAIKENGYQWNPEKMELEKIEWVPKNGDEVFAITVFGVINFSYNSGDSEDLNAFNNGLIFKTEPEAETFFDKVKQLAKNKK